MLDIKPGSTPRPLRKVVVVFKTHFDLGFTGLPGEVMAQYTGPMFRAVKSTIEATSGEPANLRYRWTLPAWPMKQFLHGPDTPEETRLAARQLIKDGFLRWHAWPFTTHTAFCDLEDLVRGLHISRALSEEFGVWPSAAKQTDVPGHTWILPTLLVRAGVKFLHLGCNPGSHSPHVPRLFWWEGPDGSRLLTYYSPGGYGTPLLPPDDWPLDTWLAVQQTVDNLGPHSPEDLAHIKAEVAERAPSVELLFGELGDFADSLFEHPEQLADLPVVPYDLADTWIHGVGTMPREVARVRALRAKLYEAETLAALLEWPDGTTGTNAPSDFPLARRIAPAIDAAYEQLMLFGEHTWGLDVKSTIKRAYGPDFEQARQTPAYKRLEESWTAKAAYVDRAEEAFAPALDVVQKALEAANWQQRASAEGTLPPGPAQGNVIENGRLRVEVDPALGGIVSLVDKSTGHEWVDLSSSEPFGGYRYDIYSAADIAEYMRAYGLFFQDWFVQDFGKQGYPEQSPHVTAYARNFESVRASRGTLTMSGGKLSPVTPGEAEIPGQAVSVMLRLAEDEPWLDMEYRIEGKATTPLAESAVIPFPLNLPKPIFRLGQVGSVIDPARDIAAGANRSLWCVDGWVDASDERVGLGVIPLDMPLVSIGSVGIYEFDPYKVPTQPTIYSHLFNTQWGTNFRQWHEGDFTFRVRIVPHAGDWRYACLWLIALDTLRPLPDIVGIEANEFRFSEGLELLSLRPRHDGTGLIMRFRDVLGIAREARVSLKGPVSNVWRCDLMECPFECVTPDSPAPNTRLKLPITAHAIETLLIEFN